MKGLLIVIPAKAGIQLLAPDDIEELDPGFRLDHDGIRA